MTHKAASFLTILSLALSSAAFGNEHGGAIPQGLSFYESTEFSDVQWSAGREGANPAWGSLVLEGDANVRFVPDSGSDVLVPYTSITSIKYERLVLKKEEAKDAKWFKRTLAFAKGVDTIRTITIEHKTSEGKKISVMRVDDQSYVGILRMLEIKTGLRAKKLSAF